MIIKTPRSLLGSFFDNLLTALGWFGLGYLLAAGACALLGTAQASGAAPAGGVSSPWDTLMLYLAIGAVNTALVVLWGRHRKHLSARLARRQVQPARDENTWLQDFQLSRGQLAAVRDSRVTVIHHSNEGEIERLETLHAPRPSAVNSEEFELGRVA